MSGMIINPYAFGSSAARGVISFVGSDVYNASVAGSEAFTTLLDPSGGHPSVLPNDLVIVSLVQGGNVGGGGGSLDATGYTQIVAGAGSATGTSALHYWAGWKVMGATPDTGVTINAILGGTTFFLLGNIHVFRGVDTTTPIDAQATALVGETLPCDPPSVTPVTAGAWILATAAQNRSASALSPATFSNPSGFDAITNKFRSTYRNATVDGMLGTAIKSDWSSGAFDPGTISGGTAQTDSLAFTFALRPGTGSAPTVGSAPTIRASRIQYVNNASSAVFTFPTGSTAGDMCVIAAAHGFGVITPTGWTQINRVDGTNCNGGAFIKTLDATDISTGSVTIGFTGAYYGTIGSATFNGPTGGVRTFASQQDSAGAASRTITTDASPRTNDLALRFGGGRFNGTVSMPLGTQLQTSSQLNASGVLNSKPITTNGADSAEFDFSATPTGDYVIEIVVAPTGSF